MFKEYVEALEGELCAVFENPKFGAHPLIKEAMAYSALLPSKKLRGVLCLEACRIFSDARGAAGALGNYGAADGWKAALPMACAIELLHTQSLIHDDLPCMDNDDLRRGKPSNHKVFGEAVAVLAGDALISYGAQVILERTPKSVPHETLLEVLDGYLNAAGAFGIVGGQVADIINEGKKVSLEELKFIHKFKTGTMFEFALNAGAILGGADEKGRNAIQKFAQNYGLAFQIKDDILDATATSEELGKTTGKDEKVQKATYVTILGLDGAKEKLNGLMRDCYDTIEAENIRTDVFVEILKKLER